MEKSRGTAGPSNEISSLPVSGARERPEPAVIGSDRAGLHEMQLTAAAAARCRYTLRYSADAFNCRLTMKSSTRFIVRVNAIFPGTRAHANAGLLEVITADASKKQGAGSCFVWD